MLCSFSGIYQASLKMKPTNFLRNFSFVTLELNNALPPSVLIRRNFNTKLLVVPLYATNIRRRWLGLGPTSKDFETPSQNSVPITKHHAKELLLRLTNEERKALSEALLEFESNLIRENYEETLAGKRWRSKFGRPSKVPTLGDVDPTGTYCPVPEDWLKKKYAATVPKPSSKELLHLSFSNAIPFVGFGFLDNFIMLLAGESIESTLGAYITLSTMAAAALGNTFSDVIGVGSAFYVEKLAAMIGLKPPKLSVVQLDMNVSRRFANLGRVVGITVGCLLGMTPLLFK